MIREFRVCGYEPEVGRYGGQETIGLAEDIFTIDSWVTAAQLKVLRTGRAGISKEVIATANGALLLDSLGAWDWPGWVSERLPRHGTSGLNQAEVKSAAIFAAPGAVSRHLEEALHLSAIRAWSDSPAPREIYRIMHNHAAEEMSENLILSLLHMQHNRLIGVDRASELRVLTLLGQIGRYHIGRRRHG
jgi:thiopeptide-type bacteriocin biosynthesis protein